MHHFLYLGVFVSLACLTHADPVTISISDLDQYSSKEKSTSSLGGRALDVRDTGNLNDGVDIHLSSELQDKVREMIKSNCEKIDNDCVESVRSVISGPDTKIEARRRPLLRGSIFATIVSFLCALWEGQEQQAPPVNIHMPSQIMSSISSVATEPTVVMVGPSNTPTVTITQAPAPTAEAAPQKPSVTRFDSPDGEHAKGDVIISLPEKMAHDMNAVIGLVGQGCPDGREFNKGNVRRQLKFFASVICSSERVVDGSAPQGEWPDLVQVPAHPRLPWGGRDAVRALNIILAYALRRANHLRITPEQALNIGQIAFDLAWMTFINDREITAHNTISISDVQEESETASVCSTKKAKDCEVGCSNRARLAVCETTCTTQTGCDATDTIVTTATEAWTAMIPSVPTTTAMPDTSCDLDDPSGLPANVFDGVFGSFCSDVDGFSNPSWLVDVSGKRVDNDIEPRTPPPNPQNYGKYRVTLSFQGSEKAWVCSRSCSEAYKLLANSPCGRTAGQQNIMARKGSVDVGCGSFSYEVKSHESSGETCEGAFCDD